MDLDETTASNPPSRKSRAARAPGVAGEAHGPGASASAEIADTAPRTSIRVVSDPQDLKAYLADWDDLAAAALEPNAFYESWMLMPALQRFAAGSTLLLVLVFVTDPARPGSPLLTGFFPLERRRGYKGLPIRLLRLWRHLHCFLTTPLIRTGYARETLEAFFGWLASDPRSGALMEFTLIGGEGPCHQALVDHLYASSRPHRSLECYTRALFRPAADADSFLAAALSGRHRKKIRYQEKQLAAIGRIEYDELGPEGDVEGWIGEFLGLEASGWKGREGSAIASHPVERDFFEAIASEAFRRGQLRMQALRLDGRAIACKCDFLAGRGSFTFKIAFDESHARHSPGLLLEIHNIQRLHAQSRTEWVDSCTHPLNPMFNRLWPGRRTIESLLVGTGKAPGDLVVSMLPLLAWLRHKLPRRGSEASPQPAEDAK